MLIIIFHDITKKKETSTNLIDSEEILKGG